MSELKEKYIQFCCDFYNEHAPEDKLWFGRMFDQCQEDYEQQNRCMYRWQFPLMILKDQEAKIDELQKQIDEGLGLIKSLYKSEFSQRSNPSIHISQIREIEKALRGENEK